MERRGRRTRQIRASLIAIAAAFALGAAAPDARADGSWSGKVEELTYGSGANQHQYILYTPASRSRPGPMPLVVAAHGCMTTADQFMNATAFNDVAEREGFAVAYVDVDPASAALPQPLRSCWRFYDPATYRRGEGHAAAVAGMTRAVMKHRRIDPERVYMAGTSAGGLMTAAMAAAYPDLFAAVSIVAGGAYGDSTCLGPSPGLPVEVIAATARMEMGVRARVVPRLVMGGDADLAFMPHCVAKAFFQGLRTNNLVLGQSQTSPLSLEASSSRTEPNPGGYPSTVDSYRDPAGCLVGERWSIHGMGHFWPGGPADEEWANFTDPKGPSGAEASWAFFSRYTRSGTAMPCAETPAAPPRQPRCVRRKIVVGMPKRARAIRVWVNGRRAKSRVARGRLMIRVKPGSRSRTVIVIRAKRKRTGKSIKRRLAFEGCGPRSRRGAVS